MKKMQKNQGITLIALVITIIILLILAGISIATLTGQNGLLTKASKAEKETDIVDTKEQIKLEIMGNFNEKTANYTNEEVKNAVLKITGNPVDENTPTVESKKGNIVDISDLWVKEIVSFSIFIPANMGKDYDERLNYKTLPETTWIEFFSQHSASNELKDWMFDKCHENQICCYCGETSNKVYIGYLQDSAGNLIKTIDKINSRRICYGWTRTT